MVDRKHNWYVINDHILNQQRVISRFDQADFLFYGGVHFWKRSNQLKRSLNLAAYLICSADRNQFVGVQDVLKVAGNVLLEPNFFEHFLGSQSHSTFHRTKALIWVLCEPVQIGVSFRQVAHRSITV